MDWILSLGGPGMVGLAANVMWRIASQVTSYPNVDLSLVGPTFILLRRLNSIREGQLRTVHGHARDLTH